MSDAELPRIFTQPRMMQPSDGITIRRATRSGFLVEINDGGNRETVACSNLADLLEFVRTELSDQPPASRAGFFRRG